MTSASVEAARREYPRPQALRESGPYDVPGAFLAHRMGGNIQDYAFMSVTSIGGLLREANVRLSSDQARLLALACCTLNDEERFDTAWKVLNLAMEYREGELDLSALEAVHAE